MSADPGAEPLTHDIPDVEDIEVDLNLVESILGSLDADDDFLAAILATNVRLRQLIKAQNAILRTTIEPESYAFEMSNNVGTSIAASDDETTQLRVPYDGVVRDIIIGWPDQADNLAGVQIRRHKTEEQVNKWFPRNDDEDFVGATDLSYPFPFNKPVEEDDIIVAQFVNNDDMQSHFINVIPIIAQVGTGEQNVTGAGLSDDVEQVVAVDGGED